MHTKEQLLDMHAEHNEWQNKIRFYRDELKQFNGKLSDVVSRGTNVESLTSVEHFQNQFILQNEVLDIMRHEFKQHENDIEALQNAERPAVSLSANHINQREKLQHFEKLFHELRNEFGNFLNKAEQVAF